MSIWINLSYSFRHNYDAECVAEIKMYILSDAKREEQLD